MTYAFQADRADDIGPIAIEAEQQLLGALLLRNGRLASVETAGGADLFHDQMHAAIYTKIREAERDGWHAGPVTLGPWADAHDGLRDIGGRGYLVRLAGASISSNQSDHYVRLLVEARAKRMLVKAMGEAREALSREDEPCSVIATRLELSLSAVGTSSEAPRPVSMTAAVTKAIEQSWAAHNGEEGDFVPTGIRALDSMLTGLYPGELILLGGRPSMGKTATALSIALNAARAGHGVAIASLEMNPEAMALRAISEATSQAGRALSYQDIRSGAWSSTQTADITAAASLVADLPITFLPRTYSEISALVAGVRQIKRQMGDDLRLLIVDYAQLLRSSGRSRYDQITEVSLALKALAGQLGIPVLALSQLSRQVESRDDKRPMLSDLRESGQLEQDADAVIFCYRDEYYLEREKPEEMDELADWKQAMERAHGKLELIVAKQRQGPIGTAHVNCAIAFNRIWEYGE